MAALKDRLRGDLTAAMKARDEVRTRTLRMALTPCPRRRSPGRRPASSATTRSSRCSPGRPSGAGKPPTRSPPAGRHEQAAAERAEGEVLDGYLPAQLGDDELAAIVAAGDRARPGRAAWRRWAR